MKARKKLEKQKGEKGRKRAVRIVGMTGNNSSEGRNKCLNAGMDEFFSKTLRFKELFVWIEENFLSFI